MNTQKLQYDVVCAGGGISGVFAAVTAAGDGAKVLLLERTGFLGGMAAIGAPLQGVRDAQTRQEKDFFLILKELNGIAGRKANGGLCINGETLKLVLQRMCREAGVTVLLYSEADGLLVEENAVKGVRATAKGTMLEIETKVVIDATGSGDLARSVGLLPAHSHLEAWGSFTLTGLTPGDLMLARGEAEEGFSEGRPGARYRGPLLEECPSCIVNVCMEPGRLLVQFPIDYAVDPADPQSRTEAAALAHSEALRILRSLSGQPRFEKARISSISPQLQFYGIPASDRKEQEVPIPSGLVLCGAISVKAPKEKIGAEELLWAHGEGSIPFCAGTAILDGESAGTCATDMMKQM